MPRLSIVGIAALICAATVGCGSSNPPDAGTTDSGAMTDSGTMLDAGPTDGGQDGGFTSICGQPGDPGNSVGNGKFCMTNADCPMSAPNCSSSLNVPSNPASNSFFCFATCTCEHPDACGEGASCMCGMGTGGAEACICIPNTCGQGRSNCEVDAGPSDGGMSDLDGGMSDAGLADAGMTDGGASDAGLADAGMTDGGASDAGSSDAGMTDGGASDAGSSDAGMTDGGSSDAGPDDAGVADAGSFDAGDLDAGLGDGGFFFPDAGIDDGGFFPDAGSSDAGMMTPDAGSSDAGMMTPDAGPVIITIKNFGYTPLNLTVAAGTFIGVVNDDSGIPHSVTSESAMGQYTPGSVNGVSFDTGIFSSGMRTITIQANAPSGTVIPFYCAQHKAGMPQGTITIQ